MDRMNAGIFSPLRNFDEEKSQRRSDSFSELLKGPDVFKKSCVTPEILIIVDENIPAKKSSSKKSSETPQKKSVKNETWKRERALPSSAAVIDSVFATSSEENSPTKKGKSENIFITKQIKDNFVTKRDGKSKSNQQTASKNNNGNGNSAKKNSENTVQSSLQEPKASGSKEHRKSDQKSSMSQPLSQIQSGVFEKIIKEAVESEFDDMRQLMWSQHLNVLKAINNTMDEMEQRRASESLTMFKIIEELLEENRVLRNAVLACQ